MNELLNLIDLLTDPTNILLIGFSAGIIAMLFSRLILWLLRVRAMTSGYITIAVGILTVILVEILLWQFYIWYNTPLGPSLELVE